MRKFLGIDLGGTNVRVAPVDQRGNTAKIAKKKVPPAATPEQCVEIIHEAALEITGSPKKLKKMEKAGIASAGRIGPDRKIIIDSPNHHNWRDVPMVNMLQEKLGMPVTLENDVNAAALGEYHFGAGKKSTNMVALFPGTGIGGGFVFSGNLYTGSSGVGAEIGHMTYRAGGLKCPCGRRGCFEAYAGGAGIEKRYANLVKRRTGKPLRDNLSARRINQAAKKGDSIAAEIWDEAFRALGVLASSLVSALNPDMLVIGGGIGLNVPGLLPYIRKFIQENAVVAALDVLEVKKAETGDNAGLLGAVMAQTGGGRK